MNLAFWKKKTSSSTNFKNLYEDKIIQDVPAVKQNILGIVTVLLFSLFSFYLSIIMLTKQVSTLSIVMALTCLIFGLILLFFMLFVLKTKDLLIWVFLVLMGIASSFLKSFTIVNLGTFLGLAFSMVLIFYGAYQMHKEAENYIRFNWRRFVKAGANYIVFGILIFLMLVFYQKYLLQAKTNDGSVTDYGFFLLEKTSSFIPYFSLNTSVDDLLSKVTKSSMIKKVMISNGLEGVVDVDSMSSLVRGTVSKMINQQLTGKETVLSVLETYVDGIQEPTIKGLIVAVLFITIFSFLNLAFFALNIITIPLGWIVLKILLWLKFFQFKNLSVEQQILSIE